MKKLTLTLTVLLGLIVLGCAATKPNWLDRQLFDFSTNQVPHIIVRTNTQWVTNMVPVFLERETVKVVTNDVGSFTVITNIQVITNFFVETKAYTNYVIQTNMVAMDSWEPKESTKEGISAIGTGVNTFAPGWGGIIGMVLTGAVGVYARLRSRKGSQALIQGIETAREIIKNVSADPTMDQRFKDWLEDQQKREGVKNLIGGLVDNGATDKPAAKEAAQAIVVEASTDTTRIRNMNAVPPTPGIVPPSPPRPV